MNPADYEYYEWLVSQIDIPNDKTYKDLFELMHNYGFVWIVPNDDNRVQDGLDLRTEFLDGTRKHIEREEVSMLEILVSLSRRVAFTAGGEAPEWAWRLLKNLKLTKCYDPLSNPAKVMDILEAVVWRTYRRDGYGGFFPLRDPHDDQTKVEIWYQLNAYVIERQR
jgi:hypothetical protein